LIDVYHDYPDFSVHITFFECAIDKSKIALLDHKKIVWKSAKDLKTLDWAEADLPVVNLLYYQEKKFI
jgi:8-oxo-dGTP diphosphatase